MKPNKDTTTNTTSFDAIANLISSLAESSGDIDMLLESVAKYYDADRAYVFENDEDGTTTSNTYESVSYTHLTLPTSLRV